MGNCMGEGRALCMHLGVQHPDQGYLSSVLKGVLVPPLAIRTPPGLGA